MKITIDVDKLRKIIHDTLYDNAECFIDIDTDSPDHEAIEDSVLEIIDKVIDTGSWG
jgi:hypothetical protein